MQSRTRFILSNICLGLTLFMAIASAYGCSGPPVAAFQANMTTGKAPLTISFTNESKNADEFTWDFGDGQTQTTASLKQTVAHEFQNAGTITVTLTATKKGNPSQTNSVTVSVTVAPGVLSTVSIKPTQATLDPLGKQTFTTEARDAFGNIIPDQKFTFKADDKSGQVDGSGVFTAGKKAGSYDGAITAEAVQGGITKSATAKVSINPGPLDRVVLTPGATTLNIAKSQDFSAAAFDAFDNAVTVTRITWSADSKAGVVDNGKLTAGTLAGSFDKALTATATQGPITASATASLTVRPDPLDAVTTSDVQLQAGATQQLRAAAADKYGNPLSDVQFTWTIKDDNSGSATSAGALTGGMVVGSFGKALEVKAAQGDIVRTAVNSVTIVPGPLAQVVVGPGQADLGMGMTQQFVAVGADQYGNRITGLSLTWSVESGGGTIDSKGIFTASSTPGSYSKTVKATAKQGDTSQSGTASVTVEPDRIAFFSTTGDPNSNLYDLYVMNADGTNKVRISEGAKGSTGVASWSPDGRRLVMDALSGSTAQTSSVLVSDDKGEWRFLVSGSQDAAHPAWSPDGKRVAYTATADGNKEIFVMDVDGGNVTRLTNNTADDYMPAWSPDGKQIAFVEHHFDGSRFYGPKGPAQIYVMNADGSEQRRLLKEDAWDTHPSWSPNGKQILFQTDALLFVWSIKVINVDGSGLRQLTPATLDANFPTWSPDGGEIMFHSWWDSDHPGIYKMSANGTGITRLSGPMSKDRGPVQAPRKRGVEINDASIVIPNSKSLKASTPQEIAALSRKAVVRIETDIARGSGFIIDPSGTIMTANHMVTNAKEINVFLDDGTKYAATVKGRDLARDVALLQINATGLPVLKFGDTGRLSLGQQVIVLGYALGSKDLSVTSGLVSAIKWDPSRNITLIQTDSAVNPGNSGGPIFNLQGEVIGVVTMKYVSTGVENVGFAVSINTVHVYLDRLKKGEIISW